MSGSISAEILDKLRQTRTSLRADLDVCRHLFRGQVAYVVRDPLTFQSHKFSAADYEILMALRGRRTLDNTFARLVADGVLNMDQEMDFYELILSLHRLGFLHLPFSDAKGLFRRYERRMKAERWQRVVGFLFLRVPLINPDAFLTRTARLVRPLFTQVALLLWLIVVGGCGWVMVLRWQSFRDPLQSILAMQNLMCLWVILVLLKIVHEFGHAYACKVFGGAVPEMGAYFIAFTPCAYVDASAAWGFPSLRQRVVVSLAGVYFEGIVGAIAFIVWNFTEPCWLNSSAHHVVVMSTVMTLGFNLNPLMRFDGYYVLSDLLGVPNLRQQSGQLIRGAVKRRLLGIRQDASSNAAAAPLRLPAASHGARLRHATALSPGLTAFLFGYGVSAALYKVILVVGICCMIALRFYWVGVGLAVLFLATTILTGAARLTRYLLSSPETAPVRRRATSVSLGGFAAGGLFVGLVPLPGSIKLTGVVERGNETVIHAKTPGFLAATQCDSGQLVQAGSDLLRLENQIIDGKVRQAEAEVARLVLALREKIAEDRSAAAILDLRVSNAVNKLDSVKQEQRDLNIQATTAGRVLRILGPRHQQRFIASGEPVAIVGSGRWVVRCLATAEEVADIRAQVGQLVRLRLAAMAQREMQGAIKSIGEKGSRRIDVDSLTHLGGGDIAVSPSTHEAEQAFFEILVRLDSQPPPSLRHGMTAHVSFRAPPRTIASLAHRRMRQFLHRLAEER